MKTWTHDEDAVLRARYPRDTAAELARLLGCTEDDVWHRAKKLGLRKRKPWSETDKRKLRFLWMGEESLVEIARAMERSQNSIDAMAFRLGLPMGPPAGCEYLANAAKRTGYSVRQLRRVCARFGVKVRRARTRPIESKGKGLHEWRAHYVESDAVDAAVAKWLETEAVATAARRRGLHNATLRRWLRDAGVREAKTSQGLRAHWRVDSKVIDEVIATRRAA